MNRLPNDGVEPIIDRYSQPQITGMIILYVVMIYLIVGLVFSVAFVTRLIGRLDEAAVGSPWTFRLLIFPGCVALWPILLNRYQKISKRKND